MMFNKSFILLAIDLIVVIGEYARNCNTVADCECGQQCVDVMDLRLCHSSTCACLEGCGVGSIFIPPSVLRANTYCNWCGCVEGMGGTPVCSRRLWCDLPWNVPVYPENPACDGRQIEQAQDRYFPSF